MSRDLGDAIGTTLGHAARDVAKTVASNVRESSRGPLSGVKGVAAGAGLAALAPLAVKGIQTLVSSRGEGGDDGSPSVSGDSMGETPPDVGEDRRSGTVDDGEVKKQRTSSSRGSRNARSPASSRSRSRSGTSS
ncbi:MAG: hypothetical protein ACJ76K_15175, partial [Solirubrobacteraceae bacterium]